jgi:hypothetical protein
VGLQCPNYRRLMGWIDAPEYVILDVKELAKGAG